MFAYFFVITMVSVFDNNNSNNDKDKGGNRLELNFAINSMIVIRNHARILFAGVESMICVIKRRRSVWVVVWLFANSFNSKKNNDSLVTVLHYSVRQKVTLFFNLLILLIILILILLIIYFVRFFFLFLPKAKVILVSIYTVNCKHKNIILKSSMDWAHMQVIKRFYIFYNFIFSYFFCFD